MRHVAYANALQGTTLLLPNVSNLPNPKFKPLIQKPGKVDASSSTEYADKWKGTLSSSLRVPVLQGFTLQSCGSEF